MAQFDQLVIGLCNLAGIPSAHHVIQGNAICCEGIHFAVAVRAQSNPDTLLLYADFGILDLEKKARLYHLMLKENFMMRGSRNGTFGVSESSGSVVLIECMSLATTTPDLLLARMHLLARKGKYFSMQHGDNRPAARPASAMQSAALRSQLEVHRS